MFGRIREKNKFDTLIDKQLVLWGGGEGDMSDR